MFNKGIKNRLICLEISSKDRLDNLEKEIKQITCEHKTIRFKERHHPASYCLGMCCGYEWTERWKECVNCGKKLHTYSKEMAWLEARLKAEKKTAGKSKKKTTKKAKKKAVS